MYFVRIFSSHVGGGPYFLRQDSENRKMRYASACRLAYSSTDQ